MRHAFHRRGDMSQGEEKDEHFLLVLVVVLVLATACTSAPTPTAVLPMATNTALPPIATSTPALTSTATPAANDLRDRAEKYYSAKKYDEAIADFTKAMELDPQNATSLAPRLARVYADRCYEIYYQQKSTTKLLLTAINR